MIEKTIVVYSKFRARKISPFFCAATDYQYDFCFLSIMEGLKGPNLNDCNRVYHRGYIICYCCENYRFMVIAWMPVSGLVRKSTVCGFWLWVGFAAAARFINRN